MPEIITAQKAKGLVSTTGWKFIQQGKTWYSKDMEWLVFKAGYLYKRRKVSPTW